MKRDFLKELELSDEQIEKIMAEHGSTLNATKQELQTAQATLEQLQGEIKTRDQQLNDLQGKAGDSEALKQAIADLKAANEQTKAEYQKMLDGQKLEYELDKSLLGAKARNPRAVRALLDRDIIKLSEDGTVAGLSEQLEKLKESDPYLFEGEEKPGPRGFTPGSNQKGNDPKEPNHYSLGVSAYERLRGKKTKEE